MSKFQYAPGLPGYGTQGADGSDGSQGLSIYFSTLDGGSQSSAIRSAIGANNQLDGSGNPLPGNRIYQTGDIFIDTNGLAYEIDLSLFNNYNATPIARLNTSTIFIEGEDTSTSVVYQRYYNAYLTTDKFVVDNVFSSSGLSGYFQNPDQANGIYGTAAKNYATINYVDLSIGNYNPFAVWNNSADTLKPEEAIALVKEYQTNTWRLGNLDNFGNVRDTSLSLDFSNFIIENNENYFQVSERGVETDVSAFIFSKTSSNIIFSGSGVHEIYTPDGVLPADIHIFAGDSTQTGSAVVGGELNIYSGDGSNTTGILNGGVGGPINFSTGEGGTASVTGSNDGRAGAGGYFKVLTGDGGNSNGIDGDIYGGDGGGFTIKSGDGGNGTATTGFGYGGFGGDVSIMAGKGGNADGDDGNEGGNGGDIWIVGGENGTGDDDQDGNGGDVFIRGGKENVLSGGGRPGWVYIDGGDPDGRVYINNFYNGLTTIGGDLVTSGEIRVPAGSAGNPSITFSIDTNLGFYRAGADELGISLGSQQIQLNEGSDGAYINPIDCSLVLQPTTTTTTPAGLGIQIIGSYSNGGPGGSIDIRGGTGVGSYDGGDVYIKGGSGGGSARGGSITIEAETGGSFNGAINLIPTSTSVGGGLYISNLTNNTSATYHLAFTGTSGPLYIDNTTPASDIKLKDIYEEIKGEKILKSFSNLQSVYWKYNEHSKEVYKGGSDTSTMHIGLIAQELQPYYPELVKSFKGDNGEEYLSIDYEMMAPLFVEAIKEQQNKINDLKSIVEKQQEQINKLLELNNLK